MQLYFEAVISALKKAVLATENRAQFKLLLFKFRFQIYLPTIQRFASL